MSLAAMLALAAGTYAFRIAGPLLRERLEISERTQQLLSLAATALLAALVATAALTAGQGFAGWARTIGVAVGGVLAWRGLPFVVVVVAAAGTNAGLLLLGLP